VAKYHIKLTLVYQYEVEAESSSQALLIGGTPDDLEKFYWVRDVEDVEVTLFEDLDKEQLARYKYGEDFMPPG
jgi:hypothetical protein